MTHPILSIIMPMYNVEQTVAAAINSVRYQRFSHWELIIVNDGSTDSSRQVAVTAAEEDPRICILDQENAGLSAARNAGLERAQGRFVHFMDSDDTLSRDFYHDLLPCTGCGADYLICSYSVDECSDSGKVLRSTRKKAPQLSFAEMDKGEVCRLWSDFFNFAWNKIFRRKFLLSHGLRYEDGLHFIEDAEFMARVAEASTNFFMTPLGGYHYRQYRRPHLSRSWDPLTRARSVRRMSIFHRAMTALGVPAVLQEETGNALAFHTLCYGLRLTCLAAPKGRRLEEIRLFLREEALRVPALRYHPAGLREKLLQLAIRLRATELIYLMAHLTELCKQTRKKHP